MECDNKEEFYSGESKELEYIICDEKTKLPQDITLFTVTLKASALGDIDNVILTKTGETDPNVVGKVTFKLVPSDTMGFPEGYYEYQVIISQGSTNRYITGGEWLIKGGMA